MAKWKSNTKAHLPGDKKFESSSLRWYQLGFITVLVVDFAVVSEKAVTKHLKNKPICKLNGQINKQNREILNVKTKLNNINSQFMEID